MIFFTCVGYDVWLPNMRGNSYSRNHTTLDPDLPEFWQFGFEESGLVDYPETIDFILEKTPGQEDLFFIGSYTVKVKCMRGRGKK